MRAERNSLIDGWRGLSVLLVIVGHLVGFRFPLVKDYSYPLHEIGLSWGLAPALTSRLLVPLGGVGVQIFFIISGFLITTLLISEEKDKDEVSIRAFYIRRIFRILPAFAVFLSFVFILKSMGLIQLTNSAFQRSIFFTCNFYVSECSWWLAHTWSLGGEEQFYLVWPLLFVLLKKVRATALLVLLIIFLGGSLYYFPLTPFAPIVLGSLFAISTRLQSLFGRIVTSGQVKIAIGIVFLKPLLPGSIVGLSLVVDLITPFLITIVFFGTILRKGPLVSVVENRLLQEIGVISYSVYLWQQLGSAPEIWSDTITGASILYAHYAVAASFFIIPAAASYVLIERPCIRIGRRISDQLSHRFVPGPKERLSREWAPD